MNNRTYEVGKVIGQIQGTLDDKIPQPMWGKLSQFAEDQNDEEVTEELISLVEWYIPDDKNIKEILIMNLENFLSY